METINIIEKSVHAQYKVSVAIIKIKNKKVKNKNKEEIIRRHCLSHLKNYVNS